MVRQVFAAAEIPAQTAMPADGDRTLVPFLEMLYEELIAHSPAHPVILQNIVQILAASLGRAGGEPADSGAIPDRLRRVRRHIAGNLHRRIGQEELAGVAGLSNSHFSVIFTRHFGISPVHYLERQRMSLAAFLLADRQIPVFEVAGRVGYSDPLYFSRRFTRHFGKSPRAFRQQPGT